MTKENAAQYLPLVQALAEGKVIQSKDYYGKFNDVPSPLFNMAPEDYRIKPEPREWWIVCKGESAYAICPSQSAAIEFTKANAGTTIHHVREVIE